MPCRQVSTYNGVFGSGKSGGGGYATEAECLQACKEGACCESNGTCSVKPQCQCQGTGKTFQGAGTVCTPNPCQICECTQNTPDYIDVTFSGFDLTYTGSTNNITNMAGYQSQLKTFLESLSLRFYADAASSVKPNYIAYKYAGGCYQNNTVLFHPSVVLQGSPCVTTSGCSDSATLLDTSSGGGGRLYCDGSFSFAMHMRTPIGCWASFPQNRSNYTLYYALQGSGSAGALNLCQGNIPSFTTSPAANNNSAFVSSFAAWSTGIYTSFYNIGTYTPSQSAEIRYTPHYANPLP